MNIPILAYHSIAQQPADWIAPFTLTPEAFAGHLDAIASSGATILPVSELADACGGALPQRVAVLTFDDGFADFYEAAEPMMAVRGFPSTLYVATAYAESQRGPGGEVMLGFEQLAELARRGVELGAHSHDHLELDTVPLPVAEHQIAHSKALIEQALGKRVRSFAYPYGYSSTPVRRLVQAAGFDSACGVGNAFSHPHDDRYRLARLLVRSTTSAAEIEAWICGRGAPTAVRRERARTRVWRLYRRLGVRTGVRR